MIFTMITMPAILWMMTASQMTLNAMMTILDPFQPMLNQTMTMSLTVLIGRTLRWVWGWVRNWRMGNGEEGEGMKIVADTGGC
jgi:hypothetical protein